MLAGGGGVDLGSVVGQLGGVGGGCADDYCRLGEKHDDGQIRELSGHPARPCFETFSGLLGPHRGAKSSAPLGAWCARFGARFGHGLNTKAAE
jgi:hypothetical protein